MVFTLVGDSTIIRYFAICLPLFQLFTPKIGATAFTVLIVFPQTFE